MSYTQDKAHSSAMLGAILDGEKAQQQSQQQYNTSDSASIFSTSSFGSAKALLKKHVGGSSSKKSKSSKSSSSGSTEAELLRAAERNSIDLSARTNTADMASTRAGPKGAIVPPGLNNDHGKWVSGRKHGLAFFWDPGIALSTHFLMETREASKCLF